jgi:hypothetical protein
LTKVSDFGKARELQRIFGNDAATQETLDYLISISAILVQPDSMSTAAGFVVAVAVAIP